MTESSDLVGTRFGRNLRAARRRAGMSQEELGWFAALHRTEIGLLERGARVPWIDTLIKVATALSVTPGSLLEGIGFDLGSETNGPSRPPSGAFTLSAEAE